MYQKWYTRSSQGLRHECASGLLRNGDFTLSGTASSLNSIAGNQITLKNSSNVTVATPAGYVPTVTGQGTDATDSNANPATTTVAAGASDLTVDFGFYQPATIGQYVWFDANADGLQTAGEAGLSNVVLTLTGTNGAGVSVSATTTSVRAWRILLCR